MAAGPAQPRKRARVAFQGSADMFQYLLADHNVEAADARAAQVDQTPG